MTEPSSNAVDADYHCSVCLQRGGPFSKRQLKRAMMGEDNVKCRGCTEAGSGGDDSVEVLVLEDNGNELENNNNNAEMDIDEEGAPAGEADAPESPPLSKEEKKRLKKEKREKKRLRKEEKRAKKAAKKEQNERAESPATSNSSTSSESNEDDAQANAEAQAAMDQFMGNDNEKQGEKNAHFSEDEEANNHAQFSDDDEAAQFSDPEAQFSDAEPTDNKENKAIPRKRKAPTSGSLIATVKAAEPAQPAPAAMTTAEEEYDFRDSDQEEYDDHQVSLSALKQTILGRKIQTADDAEEEEEKQAMAHPYTTDAKISHQLRKELACAICHECYLHPVSLLCGHSFCKECIQWWTSSAATNSNCPTCRQAIPVRTRLGVNTALRACVLALLGNEVQARLQQQTMANKGENEGAHDGGYEELTAAGADSWISPAGIPWQCRRSTMLDAEDQRMQLALGIWKDPTTNGMTYNPRTQTLRVSFCVLQMEEDEVADGGFPRVVHEDDEENEHLLATRHGGRFVHSFVRATAHAGRTKLPLGRRSIQASGVVELSLELTSPEVTRAEVVSFEHEETGAIFELKVPGDMTGEGNAAAPPGRRQTSGRTASTALELEDDEEQEHKAYDSEDDGSHMDQFENDGFIADEADDGEEPAHEDDVCAVCKDGGELMMCDGGDNIEGCNRSFHIECVNRKEVPRGDWICQECAQQLDLDVGIEGHEFPMPGICHKCEKEGVELVCDGGSHVDKETCGKKFHLACVGREDFPKGGWICVDCALRIGEEVGDEGYEFPDDQGDEDAIEIADSDPEESPPPKKKQRKDAVDPGDVIALDDDDDDSEAAEFDSPANGGRHVGGDSDEEDGGGDEDEDEEMQVQPKAKKGKAQKRIVLLDDDTDDDE